MRDDEGLAIGQFEEEQIEFERKEQVRYVAFDSLRAICGAIDLVALLALYVIRPSRNGF